MQLEKSDFLPIHKIHLLFGKYNSDELLDIYNKFKIKVNFNKDIYSIFRNQKKFLDKKNLISENNKKVYLKTLLNNFDQKNPRLVKQIFLTEDDSINLITNSTLTKSFLIST